MFTIEAIFFFSWNIYFGWKGLICCKRNTSTLKVEKSQKKKENKKRLGENNKAKI